jgi:hypothetical protein
MTTILKKESGLNRENQTHKNLYNSAQMITLVIGFMMMIMSIGGLFDESFLGLSLTPMHAFILGGTGTLAVWSGLFRDESEVQAFKINIGLGLFFAANALAGILLDGAVLNRTLFNESLVRRIAPGFLDLLIWDHLMHALLGVWFLLDAYLWKKRNPA